MKVFYVPAAANKRPYILDEAVINPSTDVYLGRFSGETIAQLAARHGAEVKIGDAIVINAQIEAALRTDPTPITEDAYFSALECLPPECWTRQGGGESFKMSERISGQITSIYARAGARYWTFDDVASLNHTQIMARIKTVADTEKESA